MAKTPVTKNNMNSFLQKMLNKMTGNKPAKKVGSLPKLKNIPQTYKSLPKFVGKK